MEITIKRVYEPASPEDGVRILVDRLWPRGVSKARADLNEWDKAVAPSTELRKSYDHVVSRFPEFVSAYRAELDANPAAKELATTLQAEKPAKVTLLYGARDETHNEAVVLKQWLKEQLGMAS